VAAIYEWRGDFDNDALNALHAEAFGHDLDDIDWRGRRNAVSLGWVCARSGFRPTSAGLIELRR
jgi:hypothetical protein